MGGRPSDEEQVFILSIYSRSSRSELWRVEKAIQALPQIDYQVRQGCEFTGRLPDRSIFSGHSPAKVDARRDALNQYFETLLDTPMTESAALVICRFLSSDAIEPRDDETNLLRVNGKGTPELVRGPNGKLRKEGYLTKRGKNFGGWKSRYFVLHGPEFKYFESPSGAHLGTIKLHNAQIGKQSQGGQNQSPSRGEDDSDNHYRHAFLILEPKKKDSSALVRHVLCAESDDDRDLWVDALLQYVDDLSSDEEKAPSTPPVKQPQKIVKTPAVTNPKSQNLQNNNRKDSIKGSDSPDPRPLENLQSFSFDDAVAAEPPVFGTTYEKDGAKTSPALGDSTNAENQFLGAPGPKTISGPTNGAVIQDVGAWGNKPATSTKEKKRSIWGFRARSASDIAAAEAAASQNSGSPSDRRDPVRPVFGMPLAEAVLSCPPRNVQDTDLPAVAYRCIEYLQAKGAASEEGIFRLSGSNVVIKALKERFNTEGDVDFLTDETYYDVHAVASLFKQYLRELPTTVLTLELQYDFRRVPG
jgi:RalA-binding protein 1